MRLWLWRGLGLGLGQLIACGREQAGAPADACGECAAPQLPVRARSMIASASSAGRSSGIQWLTPFISTNR